MAWKDLLRSFAGLALCWAGAERLLKDGQLKETARMAFGLLTMLIWLQGLKGMLPGSVPDPGAADHGLLQPVAAMYQAVPEAWKQLLERRAGAALQQIGCRGTVEMGFDQDGALTEVRFHLAQGDAQAARSVLAETLGMEAEAIRQE